MYRINDPANRANRASRTTHPFAGPATMAVIICGGNQGIGGIVLFCACMALIPTESRSPFPEILDHIYIPSSLRLGVSPLPRLSLVFNSHDVGRSFAL